MVTLIAEWSCQNQNCEAEGIGGMDAMEKAMARHSKQTSHPCQMSAVPIDSEEGKRRVERGDPAAP